MKLDDDLCAYDAQLLAQLEERRFKENVDNKLSPLTELILFFPGVNAGRKDATQKVFSS